MRRLLCLLVFGVVSARPAYGQDAARRALAERVLEVADYRAVLRLTDSTYAAQLLRLNPTLEPYRDVVEQWTAEVFAWDALGPAIAAHLAGNFTAAELQGILDFYRTPAGQKWLQVSPDLRRYLAELTMTAVERGMPELRRRVQARAHLLEQPAPRLN